MRNGLLLLSLSLVVGLCFIGCETQSESETNQRVEPRVNEPPQRYAVPTSVQSEFTNVEQTIRALVAAIKPANSKASKDELLSEIRKAQKSIQNIDESLAAAIASAPADDVRSDLNEAKKAGGEAAAQLTAARDALDIKQKQELSDDERVKVLGLLTEGQKQLGSVKNELAKAATRIYQVEPSPAAVSNSALSDWLPLAGAILVAIILVGIVIFGGRSLIAKTWAALDSRLARVVNSTVDGVQRHQGDLSAKLNTLSSNHTDINSRLSEIQFEVKSIGRLVRDWPSDRYERGADVHTSSVSTFVEPAFPVSVTDYLQDKRSSGTVIRPDFHRGILVTDPANEAELMLVADSRANGEFIMVPRVAQFQTRQDFHTYFGKYYHCQDPRAGDVWIINPAVVSTVPGGWELREKGVLEVR